MALPLLARICILTLAFQGSVSGLLILACIATAVAATVLCVNSLIWQTNGLNYKEINSVCDRPNITATSYRRSWRSYNNQEWKVERCRNYMTMMMVRKGQPSRDPP